MDLNQFATKVSEFEGGKKETDIAQIKEVLRVTNDQLDGKLYDLINEIELNS
jgi:uncharacterized protein (DUF2267 family)